ncbi:hypothetical protein Goari_018268, partial [Gossypium aridum]|nr:hypothetical protein [Gossypium aridum]
ISSDEKYYIILQVGGHFVKDPYVRNVGGEVIRLKENSNTISYFELCKIVKIGLGFNTIMLIYFHEPSIVRLQNNLKVIYDDTSTIATLDFWIKFKKIDLYVEHEVDNSIIVDTIFLLAAREGDVKWVEVDGEGDDEGDFATLDRVDNIATASSGEEGDGNETKFKSIIQKYRKECRRQLKFIKNEPKRVVVRCIASPNCPWRIRASYSPIAKCLQLKTFQDEHHCLVSLRTEW